MALIVGGVTVTGTQVLDATKIIRQFTRIKWFIIKNLPAASSIPTVSYNTVGSFSFIRRIVGNTSAGASNKQFFKIYKYWCFNSGKWKLEK